MDREKVIQAVEDAFDLIHSDFIGTDDFNETEWEQTKADALSLLKEQKQIKEESITPFEVLDIISSSYGGKQIFFQEENGMIYDRYKCEYITLEDAVYRMAKMVGDDGDA